MLIRPAMLSTIEAPMNGHLYRRKGKFVFLNNSIDYAKLVPTRALDTSHLEFVPGRRLLHAALSGYPYMLNSCILRRPLSSHSNIVRETNTAVKTLAAKPIVRVTANPRTGPSPNRNRNAQETIVVTCVSTIVHQAFPKPASTAETTDLPARSSSRMRSKIRTFESTAIPTVRIIPAIPGNVSTAWK